MSGQQIFEIPASAKEKAWIDNDTYLKMYKEYFLLPSCNKTR